MGTDDRSQTGGRATADTDEVPLATEAHESPHRRPAGVTAALPPLPADRIARAARDTVSASALSDLTDDDLDDPPAGDAPGGDDVLEIPIGAERQTRVHGEPDDDPLLPYRRTASMKPLATAALGARAPLSLAETQPAAAVGDDAPDDDAPDDDAPPRDDA